MRQTIKKHKDFAMGDDALVGKSHFFIAKARPTIFSDGARYGLIATKRTFKLAVHRNRAKRLLRVWIRENQALLQDNLDYIFIARHGILHATKEEGVLAMSKALTHISRINA